MSLRSCLPDFSYGFKVVRTNIEEGLPPPKELRRVEILDVPLDPLLEKADVIFLCEMHNTAKYLTANSSLVTYIWRKWNKECALLTESEIASFHLPNVSWGIQKS